VSEYARLGLAAVALALRDAGLESWEAKRPIGIVASTRLGCLETDVEFYETVLPTGGGLARPSLFAYTLPNCFTGEAAIQFGLTGPTIVAYDAAGDALAGLRLGLECLSADDCDALLAGHLDLPASPALPGVGAVVPGAVFLMLEKRPARALPRYGRLDLSAGDLRHEGVVMADVAGLVRACRKTLES
jgi:3-oxoacyl-[acyl-carrier-protein] synthase II